MRFDQVCLIALGGNQPSRAGSPAHTIRAALRHLEARGAVLAAVSAFYATPAYPPGSGPGFINAAAAVRMDATPEDVLATWRGRGLPSDLNPESMDRYFRQVEEELRIQPGTQPYLGPIADLVARGADAMGLSHAPLPRNAEGCDGQGSCAFGCPTEAKRSTNVSYIPRALRAGAELFTGMKVERLLMRGQWHDEPGNAGDPEIADANQIVVVDRKPSGRSAPGRRPRRK